MHTPKHCDDNRIDVLHAFMRPQPLAAVVTLGAKGLIAKQSKGQNQAKNLVEERGRP